MQKLLQRQQSLLQQEKSYRDHLQQADQTAINYTISQDFAAGCIAEQEKNLQGFLGNEQADPFAAQVAAGSRANRALQDYQTQLMLLEQQDKKRLLLAQEEGAAQEQQGYYRI